MILLDETREGRPPRLVSVVGAGLIGSAVVERLESSGRWRRELLPLDWEDGRLQERQLAALAERVADRLAAAAAGARDAAPPRLAVLWSAGRSGFGATAAEAERELASFRRVLETTLRLAEEHPGSRVSFGMISSAGGLFEGQRVVTARSVPAPRRPYGELKLAQEEMLAGLAGGLAWRVYRLTSIYGATGTSPRRGLIPTLILNGIRQRVTAITGSFSTLRDYVWVGDVATYVAADLTGAPAGTSRCVLASAKPSSIFEIRRLIERVVGRPLYLTLSGDATNRADITFAHDADPAGWRTSSLETCVRAIYRGALSASGGAAPGEA